MRAVTDAIEETALHERGPLSIKRRQCAQMEVEGERWTTSQESCVGK